MAQKQRLQNHNEEITDLIGEINGSPTAIPYTGDAEITPSTSDLVLSNGTWLQNGVTIKGDTNLKPENIKDGVTLFGVLGTLKSEGVHIWKKYKLQTAAITAHTINIAKPMRVQYTTPNGIVPIESIIGSQFNDYSQTNVLQHTIDILANNKEVLTYASDGEVVNGTYTYDIETGILTHDTTWGYGALNTEKVENLTSPNNVYVYQGLTLSDDETTYPDGGIKDGYYYIKVQKQGMFVNKSDESGNAIDVSLHYPKGVKSRLFYFTDTPNALMEQFNFCENVLVDTPKVDAMGFYSFFRYFSGKLKLKNITELKEGCFAQFAKTDSQIRKKKRAVFIPASVTTSTGSTASNSPFYDSHPDVKIYCEAPSKPEGFQTYWQYRADGLPLQVQWGVSEAEFDAL